MSLRLYLYHLECGLWLKAVALRMEYLMSQESDAARAEVDALKTELATFVSTHVSVAAQVQEAADDKQALVDLTTEVNAMRATIAPHVAA